ncbi:MAG: 3-methyl-2-oxobutanoate dehydrogenase subunit VorB [Bacteroidia bacterium]|nr:3-methyl-2-oxobutanoate dehydrogenase subunit VorB [Bacteroidia bacterium]NNF29771.1 3-methyl-2-oxobutanoate dehydrogenase subunit VorB [Flavobacteriaceae bacterium]MBT8274687.1 3-methyl-2-oxobutanoate dehydrogenase subunit VorB [Bacteroidia bacterium]NNJ82758.1 3-methyl-2-oxobutanoate dehydrogenase subunit VorB [Flavobacteriaceae bacterium]NNK55388.1 3-methyl-2-oxobutanoate dehydrogenase subunit VorB [Flavobacteriaceae bacterium]
MKGNEALAEAAIRAGADAYFGYPITPQSEVIEYLMDQRPEKRTGMVVLQAESEIAAINMVYGAASSGKRVMTSSSSPGISLKMEGISYLAGAELPAVIVNVVRGGPGLGTIQPSQADYNQAVKGGGHGDYRMYVLAPASVQEMSDFVSDAFDIAFKYRTPVMILSDGLIGQMMEKVVLKDERKRLTDAEIDEKYGSWATTGRKGRERNIITSLYLEAERMEQRVRKLMNKYQRMEEEDLRYEMIHCDDAEYLFVAYGSSARIAQKAVELGREKGIKVGLLRPITLFPFPKKQLFELADQVKGVLSVEMNAGQMVDDVRLAVEHKVPVEHFGRTGGIIHTPEEILEALEQKIVKDGSIRHHTTREPSLL